MMQYPMSKPEVLLPRMVTSFHNDTDSTETTVMMGPFLHYAVPACSATWLHGYTQEY